MTEPTASITVAVDPTNPGQFFACCGLLELADRLWPGAEGWFAEEGRAFNIYGNGKNQDDLLILVDELLSCKVSTQLELDTVAALEDETTDTEEDTETEGGKKPKSDPVILGSPLSFVLSWWLRQDGSDNLFKTWAANATSQQMFRKWVEPLRALRDEIVGLPSNLLGLPVKIQGSYGFDSLLGRDAFDIGFSLNEHNDLKKLPTRPAVELLGAIGLQSFRPALNERERTVTYATWTARLLPNVARAVASGMIPDLASTVYRCQFVSRGTFKGLDFATPVGQGDTDE